MCLISVCPKGTEKNTEKVKKFILSGADSNRQGSGFMYKKDGTNKIVVNKGHFAVDQLLAAIEKAKLGIEDELVIHHRIGTSGEVSTANTHPFIISKDSDECAKVDAITTKPCIVHNGVFRDIDKYEKLNPKMSDTFAFARYIMSDPRIMDIFLTDKELFDSVMDGIVGSDKLCLLFPDRDLEMYGNFVKDEGYFHSNGGYCKWVYNRGGVETEKGGSGAGFGNRFRNQHAPIFSTATEHDLDSFDAATPVHLLPASNDDGKKLNKVILLDSSIIDLGIDNYKHFWYAKKVIWDNSTNKDSIKLFEVNNFDMNCLVQATVCKETPNVTNYKTISTKELLDQCYYIPKGEYYTTIYRDYKSLYERGIIPTLNGVKTLRKVITKNYQKRALEQLNYKKLNKKFCKQALVMHLKDLEGIMETGPNGSMKNILQTME